MPLYEYQCTKCGHLFEMIQKFSDPPKRKCPKCGDRLRKLLSAPAIQFKGSGWYVTDYGKGNAAGTNKKPENKQAKDDTASASARSEDKPKSEPKGKDRK